MSDRLEEDCLQGESWKKAALIPGAAARRGKGIPSVLTALACLFVLSGDSCPPKPTPSPTPTPAPTPTPTPSPEVPPVGTPVAGEMLPRQNPAGGLQNNAVPPVPLTLVTAIPCCWDFTVGAKIRRTAEFKVKGVSTRSGWPLVSDEWMAYTRAKGGANAFHRRFGPFLASEEPEWAQIGGPYLNGHAPNPAFWAEVRRQNWEGTKNGTIFEDVIFDDWGFKYVQNGGGQYIDMSPEAIAAYGHTWLPEHTGHLRLYVQQVGCFGNRMVALDNEGPLISHYNIEFWRTMLREYRTAEKELGCGFVAMVGSSFPELMGEVDYTITHDRAPLTALVAGKFRRNNEHNPEFAPEQEAAYWDQARKIGGEWALWRAEQTQPEYDDTLARVKALKDGSGPPAGCFAPPSEDPLWSPGSGSTDQSAMSAVKASQASIGDRCGHVGPLPDDPGNVHGAQEESLSLLAQDLRAKGYCASGPWGDALAVMQADHLWAEVHAIEFGGGCWTTGAQNYPKNLWKYNGTNPTPSGCPIDVPPVTRVDCKQHSPASIYDCTPKANGQPILPEGDPNRAACELKASGGPPSYSLRTEAGALSLSTTENPWQVRIEGHGTGFLTCTVPSSQSILCNLAVDR